MRVVFFGAAGAVPSASDGNVSFAVQAAELSVLIDTSGNPVQNLLRAQLEPRGLDAVVLTHTHTDHIYALPSLIHALWLMKRKKTLCVFANPPTAERARQLLDLGGLLSREGLFELQWCQAHPDLAIRLFPVSHSVPTCGVFVGSSGAALVYGADTAPVESVVDQARGCQAMIHEASGEAQREGLLNAAGHSSARQAAQAAARAGVDTLFLCHFDHSDPRARRRLRQEAGRSFTGRIICPQPYRWYEVGAG